MRSVYTSSHTRVTADELQYLMITSMTGFARYSAETEWGFLTWELRSLNHRYFELSLYLPDGLREGEMQVREKIKRGIQRGKVDAALKFIPNEKFPCELMLNSALLKQFSHLKKELELIFPGAEMDLMRFLSWPQMVQSKLSGHESIQAVILDTLQETLQRLLTMRQQEGGMLSEFLKERLHQMTALLLKIEERLPLIQQNQRQKMEQRFSELSLQCNPDRLEQELVFLLQKSDIAEELARLRSHIQVVQSALAHQEVAVGRRFDFLMQELNREANTLASKSVDSQTTQFAIELKVLIEQMREQVQNIE